MNQAVDLSNLRNITGGDAMLERELFDEFFTSSQECLRRLRESLAAEDQKEWRAAAHAYKGICLGLGAMQLGNLCKQAQEGHMAAQSFKQHILSAIEKELEGVRKELGATRN